MVSLNFTLLVELGLFLLFVWGCHTFIFRPVLRQLDERDDKIADDVKCSEQEQADAANLEDEYSRQLAAARRAVSDEFRRSRYEAQQEQDTEVLQAKKAAEAEVARAHEAACQMVEAQRAEFERLAPDVAATLAKKLGFGDLL